MPRAASCNKIYSVAITMKAEERRRKLILKTQSDIFTF